MDLSSLQVEGALGQLRAYEVGEVEAFLAAASDVRDRLLLEVADAHARALAARERLAASTTLRDRLGSMMLEVQRAVISRRAEVETAVARITEAAEAEAEAILANARAEAATLKSRTAILLAAGHDRPPAVIDLTLRPSQVG